MLNIEIYPDIAVKEIIENLGLSKLIEIILLQDLEKAERYILTETLRRLEENDA